MQNIHPHRNTSGLHRREFLRVSSAGLALSALAGPGVLRSWAADDATSLKGRIYKTLKIGMVQLEGSLTDKFKGLKSELQGFICSC